MIQKLIYSLKRKCTEHYLCQTYQCQYAFVGMGQHSLTNLYPVLRYLGVSLKYICVTTTYKAKLIERKYPLVKATVSLDEVLNDEEVKGVFVSALPSAHFSIASQVLKSGKSLFIEKPPCQTLVELDVLISLQRQYGSSVAMVGMQKRYAPAVRLLRKRLGREQLLNYDMHYLTGAYPEGDALLDLYIHPVDLVCHLFGQPGILACRKVAKDSYILMLQHPHVAGMLELSAAYSWTGSEETLKICTRSGIYRLEQMEELMFEPKPSSIFGLPTDKMIRHHALEEHLYQRNNAVPIPANNQIYSQGFFNEIEAFVSAIEHSHSDVLTSLPSLRMTYGTLLNIK